jgi:hypothetical protein
LTCSELEPCEEDIIINLDFHQSLLILYQLLSFGCPLTLGMTNPVVDVRRSLTRTYHKEVRCCMYLHRWGKSSSDNSLSISAVSTSNGLQMLGAIIQATCNYRVVLFDFALLGLTPEIIKRQGRKYPLGMLILRRVPLPKHQG